MHETNKDAVVSGRLEEFGEFARDRASSLHQTAYLLYGTRPGPARPPASALASSSAVTPTPTRVETVAYDA